MDRELVFIGFMAFIEQTLRHVKLFLSLLQENYTAYTPADLLYFHSVDMVTCSAESSSLTRSCPIFYS
jgi:hypothetical protein